MISDVKSFIWNFFGNSVNKADGTVKDSTACTVITAYKVAKYAIKADKDIVSTKN